MTTANTTLGGGFAAAYDALMWPFERAAVGAWRRRLAARARGRVLEIGAGTGSQLRWYGAGLEVTAVEPDPDMARRALRRAAGAAARVRVIEAPAEALPFADGSFDTAVATFCLCTVADPAAALSELRRVLVPGGRLLAIEHVHLSWQPGRRLQSLAAPAWASVAGGCRLDRDTVAAVGGAGFDVLEERRHVLGWIVEVAAGRPFGLHEHLVHG
jgi:ubiquinone/menaquinone biosynthesis C-methylase UbiE